MGTLIRILILSWSAALLTASYAGALSKMDPTFIATVFTASAATFGINTMKKGGDDDDDVMFSFKSNLSNHFGGRTPSFYKQTLPPLSAISQCHYPNHPKNTSINTSSLPTITNIPCTL